LSTYTLDAHRLWTAGDRTVAAGYLVGTLLACVAATAVAVTVVRALVAGRQR
jgi:fluoride ion exporter CrcB/FEX